MISRTNPRKAELCTSISHIPPPALWLRFVCWLMRFQLKSI